MNRIAILDKIVSLTANKVCGKLIVFLILYVTPIGQRRRSAPTPQTESQPSRREELVERYVSYSIAHHLRKYIEPRSEQQDPELDVEAQFGRSAVRSAQTAIEKKRALQCISGWLWCKYWCF